MDGPYNGPPPGTWDIYQEKPPPFVETTYYHVVPHTEEVRNRDLLSPNLDQGRVSLEIPGQALLRLSWKGSA